RRAKQGSLRTWCSAEERNGKANNSCGIDGVAAGGGLLPLPVCLAVRTERHDAATVGGVWGYRSGGCVDRWDVLLWILTIQPGRRGGGGSIRREERNSNRSGTGWNWRIAVRHRQYGRRQRRAVYARCWRRICAGRRGVSGDEELSCIMCRLVYWCDANVWDG